MRPPRRSFVIHLAALALLAALVTVLRLPALPQSVLDWDESIYLLMAVILIWRPEGLFGKVRS